MAVLERKQLMEFGFAAIGENVAISDKASFYNCPNISIGSNVRIDDFCVLSAGVGGISLGNNIHLAINTSLIGDGRISISDFSTTSSRVAVYSSNDDYSGEWMTNPTVPCEFTGVTRADVVIGRHVIIGSGSVILPGVEIGDGVAVGALSLIKNNCSPFGIYCGVPALRSGERKRRFLELEEKYLLNTRSINSVGVVGRLEKNSF